MALGLPVEQLGQPGLVLALLGLHRPAGIAARGWGGRRALHAFMDFACFAGQLAPVHMPSFAVALCNPSKRPERCPCTRSDWGACGSLEQAEVSAQGAVQGSTAMSRIKDEYLGCRHLLWAHRLGNRASWLPAPPAAAPHPDHKLCRVRPSSPDRAAGGCDRKRWKNTWH